MITIHAYILYFIIYIHNIFILYINILLYLGFYFMHKIPIYNTCTVLYCILLFVYILYFILYAENIITYHTIQQIKHKYIHIVQ